MGKIDAWKWIPLKERHEIEALSFEIYLSLDYYNNNKKWNQMVRNKTFSVALLSRIYFVPL